MLKLEHVSADGGTDAAPVPVTITHPRTGQPTGATVWVQVAPQEEIYAMGRKCRRHEVDPATKAMRQTVDGVKLQQMVMAKFVKRWEGLAGADGVALPCTPAVMNALPEWLADQITEGIRGIPPVDEPDAAEVREASFRESD